MMFNVRTSGFAFSLVLIGTLLQLIGLATPGWSIFTSIGSDQSSSGGLWSVVKCYDGDCKTVTYYERYRQALQENPKSTAGVQYAQTVGKQVIGVLSLTVCVVACVLSFLIYRNHTRKEQLTLLTACLLFVAGSLIWTVIGVIGAVTVVASGLEDDSSTLLIGTPYSLVTSAFGSFLTTTVAFIMLSSLHRQTMSSNSQFAYGELQDNQTPSVFQLNLQNPSSTVS